MNPIVPVVLIQLVAFIESGSAQTLYFNGFSSPDRVQEFTIIGESFVTYRPPPLHAVSISNGQLRIDTDVLYPNGPNTFPVLSGSALLMRSYSDFGSGFTNILSENTNIISWAFNVANADGSFNNKFNFILGSTIQDPTLIAAKGY